MIRSFDIAHHCITSGLLKATRLRSPGRSAPQIQKCCLMTKSLLQNRDSLESPARISVWSNLLVVLNNVLQIKALFVCLLHSVLKDFEACEGPKRDTRTKFDLPSWEEIGIL